VLQTVSKSLLHKFMSELSRRTTGSGKIYFAGGATALLLGFREQTVDIDIKIDPEPKGIFEAIAAIKNELDLNIELAAPSDFIPASPLWRDLASHITDVGDLSFFHYDLALQALAKVERGFSHDLADASNLVAKGYVSVEQLMGRFDEIEPYLIRYPAINPKQFKSKFDNFLSSFSLESK
jgi:hypothetical protein